MLDILQGTPLWVYAVFALICYYGLRALTTTRESRRSLLLTPLILLVWSLWSVNLGEHAVLALGAWAGGAALGSLLALLLFSSAGVLLESDGEAILVPGTLKILGISLLFFAVKYWIGYQTAVHPEQATSVQMLGISGAAAGFTVGLFCGRAFKLYRNFLQLRLNA
ncbi:hypothetical protein DNK59_00985 [Pseudomonas sp. TKO26]|uniref:Uncharacterized protein n=1 Tax=Pseudomonas saponiphila TaxID=556534 RepID=A0A1H4K444_9PSED|nr:MULTISPECIES: DUF6622 family protein [Pseudomonas]PYY92156.1 hypothetical protein DNK62_00985 [Pseudomonas sp. TKO30]PYY94519.1 hypothetical protein DNK61_00985 [Pseudomonas sp. TKO29]PYY96392.1 hypothetical protein DNK59_00985 [Pseudomonas sp. TKO26]PYZ01984.1 hypothetical protein DNK60_00985 [Pseudomonas sp. TKO14]SEB53167.1 hypothetical protein SAMN05216178_1022 [Pseudomonas saponiphila]